MLPTHRYFASPRQIPTATFFSEVKNSWKTISLLITTQCLATLYTSVTHGTLPHEATNTDLLYNPSITVFVMMFLTFNAGSFLGFLLAGYNAVILTALLAWPHSWSSRPSPKEIFVQMISIMAIVVMRMVLGYLFSRGTGWAYPVMFFNDAIHETTCGLSVIVLYCIGRRAYSDSSPETGRAFLLKTLLLWSPNSLRGPVFFWSFSAASVAGIQGLSSLLSPSGRQNTWHNSPMRSPSTLMRFIAMLKTFFVLTTVFTVISYFHTIAYRYDHSTHSQKATNLPESVLAQFLLLSHPRRNDSALLSSTLQSYTQNLGSRFTAKVYTTVAPTSHSVFDGAKRTFRGTPGLDFFSDPDPANLQLDFPRVPGHLPGKQTLDLFSALSWAETTIRPNSTRYLGIMEDDFEWCTDGWNELKAILYEVALEESSSSSQNKFCGIFVATGGSGLLVRPSVIPLLRNALQRHAFQSNPDIILQDCLRGALSLCSGCRLAASRRLLLRHTGASESTYRGRFYPENRWQCGWRQPFNGRLGVWVP